MFGGISEGIVFGPFFKLQRLFWDRFWSLGRSFWTPKWSLFESSEPFGSILGPGPSQDWILPDLLTPLGRFWEHFGADLELFGGPKVRKSGPKSIPKTNRILDLDFS